jgi:hypothetical protein
MKTQLPTQENAIVVVDPLNIHDELEVFQLSDREWFGALTSLVTYSTSELKDLCKNFGYQVISEGKNEKS